MPYTQAIFILSEVVGADLTYFANLVAADCTYSSKKLIAYYTIFSKIG